MLGPGGIARPERLRILYIWDADYPWDVRTEKVCSALTAAGHDVHLVARNRRRGPVEEQLPEGLVHRMPPWHGLGTALDNFTSFPAFINPRWIGLIDRTARKVSADLIVVRDLPLCPTAVWVGRRQGIPILFDMAENYPAQLSGAWETGRARPIDLLVRNPRLARIVEKYAVTRVDRIMVVIQEAGEHLERLGVDRNLIDVVSNTPAASRALAPRVTEPSADVTYLGLMEVVRGLADLIDAVALLAQRGIRVRTRLIGAGRDFELLKSRAAGCGLGPDLMEFTGYIPGHGDALALASDGRIGILPHLSSEWAQTTIPNKLFDYMAAGLAVLTSNVRPCQRLVDSTGAGRTFIAGSVEDLARVLEEMLRDPRGLTAAGDAGRQAILERHNWERDSAILLNSVSIAAGQRRSRSPVSNPNPP